ncbi:MAG TPA: S-formylglutathione hydrolase [Xanthomonadales bacterium]|nr:S-formylglutathione hydrolase [Xanthomonadales bacterium]
MEHISTSRLFEGELKRFKHSSISCNCVMTFAIYLPPQAQNSPVPVLYWLSGLTCTDENFMQKSGVQRVAAELGMAIVAPDTSPRGTDLPGEHDSYDLGSGAGFYVNATQEPWSGHYQMYDYVTQELPKLVESEFPVTGMRGVSGHSMGGHGALVCYLKNPGFYHSVSAFAPISNPSNGPWGQKAFSAYLGEDRDTWQQYDAAHLIGNAQEKLPILIDQGTEDEFLGEELKPGALEQGAIASHYPLELRYQDGYDHSYFFIATFIEDHLRHHAKGMGI